MATKISKSKTTKPESVLDVPVDFGGVSIGESTARLGIKVSRDRLNLVAADEIFCGHRLTGRVLLGHIDDDADQMAMFDDADVEVNGSFDVKGLRVTADSIATGLTFSLSDIDVATLAQFSKGKGRVIVSHVAEIPHDKEDDVDLDHVPGTLKTNAPWREVSLSTLFEGGLLKNLKAAGLDTVGKLSDYTASERRLTDIGGVGNAAGQKIEDRMLQFWAANQQSE